MKWCKIDKYCQINFVPLWESRKWWKVQWAHFRKKRKFSNNQTRKKENISDILGSRPQRIWKNVTKSTKISILRSLGTSKTLVLRQHSFFLIDISPTYIRWANLGMYQFFELVWKCKVTIGVLIVNFQNSPYIMKNVLKTLWKLVALDLCLYFLFHCSRLIRFHDFCCWFFIYSSNSFSKRHAKTLQ